MGYAGRCVREALEALLRPTTEPDSLEVRVGWFFVGQAVIGCASFLSKKT